MGSLTLKPIDSNDPPDGLSPQSQVRGIVFSWRAASPPPNQCPRRQRLQLPLSDWQEHLVGFNEVSPSGVDQPPLDATE